MKKLLILATLLLVPSFASAQQDDEYHAQVLTSTNVAHYIMYDEDAIPNPHQNLDGPGYLYFSRHDRHVSVGGKIDIQASVANVTTTLCISLPYAPHFLQYWHAWGNGTNPGSKPSMSIWASVMAFGHDDCVVLTFVPTTTDMRAYMIDFTYRINETPAIP